MAVTSQKEEMKLKVNMTDSEAKEYCMSFAKIEQTTEEAALKAFAGAVGALAEGTLAKVTKVEYYKLLGSK